MSFPDRETSNQDGSIVSLYEFQWGFTFWRYTSADRDIVLSQIIDGEPTDVTYTKLPIWDDGMVQGGSSNNDVQVHAPSNIPLADLFHSTPPASEINLTIRRRHHGDENAFIYWKGYVINVKRDVGNAGVVILGETILASFNGRSGLRLGWTRGCPFILYDQDCTVNPDMFDISTTIAALTGDTVTLSAYAGDHTIGRFTGGYIEWEATPEGTLDRRGVKEQTTEQDFVLLGTTYRLEVGMIVRIYPGCDLTTTMCRERFNNIDNYGGCAQMTGKNPFDGTRII